jgi:hypothetical protein
MANMKWLNSLKKINNLLIMRVPSLTTFNLFDFSIFSFLRHGWETFSGARVAQTLDFCVKILSHTNPLKEYQPRDRKVNIEPHEPH